jgi:hypothetical protein
MAIKFERWRPSKTITRQEKALLKRCVRVKKLFRFLRECRDALFDDAFQQQLEEMYRRSGAGKPPVPPALMAMASLLQGYVGASDAEAVELTVVDLRWQMVLGCLGNTEPAFSQGALHDFRHRMIRGNMDRRLLERTVELACQTKGFDAKKLPKTLRIATDSSPLEGAGRVEDTVNLLGHGARNVVACVAALLDWEVDEVCAAAGIPVLLDPSVKKGLDCEWGDPTQKTNALQVLVDQLASLQTWIEQRLPEEIAQPPLKETIDTLKQLIEQDLEPDPGGGGNKRIRRAVAEDRRVSVEESEMRHGRKSSSKRFNGYKRHIAADLDTGLIMSCAVAPANRPEGEAAPELQADIEHQGFTISQLYIDRGYINSSLVDDVLGRKGDVFCKPWVPTNKHGHFTKAEFRLNMRAMTVTCPAEEVEPFKLGDKVEFDACACDICPLRDQCTSRALGKGRMLRIGDDEHLQQRLRKRIATPKGREQLRQRIPIEHKLAHIGQRQGRRARYFGVRCNLYDLRRASSIQNLETLQRKAA